MFLRRIASDSTQIIAALLHVLFEHSISPLSLSAWLSDMPIIITDTYKPLHTRSHSCLCINCVQPVTVINDLFNHRDAAFSVARLSSNSLKSKSGFGTSIFISAGFPFSSMTKLTKPAQNAYATEGRQRMRNVS